MNHREQSDMAAADIIYKNDAFEDDADAADAIRLHPEFIKMEATLKELERDLDYHKTLCRQLQTVAISGGGAPQKHAENVETSEGDEEQEQEHEHEQQAKPRAKAQSSKKTKVDVFVEEMMSNPGAVTEEVCDAVKLAWDKKKPSRGFMKEYLRMKFHTQSMSV